MTEDPTTLIEVPVTDSAPWVQFSASEGFSDWLVRHNCSLAFTTYQAGKLFFIGHRSSNQLSIFERTFNRCMGLCVDGQSLWMSSHFQLWRFENVLNSDETYEGYDRLYIPRTAFTTGDLDIHDVAVDRERNPVFVNTRFGCLATLSDRHSFKPLWIPPHLTELVAEDRCHLNGLAMENGQPRFVTLVSLSNQVDQWRNHRVQGGCLLEIPSGRVRLSGLTMPHSPRIYQNRIWLHNSGCGEFGYLDESTESFRPIAFCPGYLRGLAFVEN
ncbi:MAG: TIGR03032 family protein, partial [Planctomycetes bacterium]|nr:TIGR03032 family protein [Planctomycetota bacterium]